LKKIINNILAVIYESSKNEEYNLDYILVKYKIVNQCPLIRIPRKNNILYIANSKFNFYNFNYINIKFINNFYYSECQDINILNNTIIDETQFMKLLTYYNSILKDKIYGLEMNFKQIIDLLGNINYLNESGYENLYYYYKIVIKFNKYFKELI
jgi:hypothetical protein